MNKNFENLEAKLRKIFEEKLIRIIPGNNIQDKLFDDLNHAMENALTYEIGGEVHAPNNFIIYVPFEKFADWQAHQDVLNEIADFLFHSGMSRGFSFSQHPNIIIRPLDNDLIQDFLVSANFTEKKPSLPDTSAMTNKNVTNKRHNIPDRAYFIVGGRENYLLDKPVINIGRHSDNDLILDEPHVSRHHAQLRAINKRYVIFDVGSTGGVMINGKMFSQTTLKPGDVIRIGLVNLIYVQETTSENQTTALPVDDNLTSPEGDIE